MITVAQVIYFLETKNARYFLIVPFVVEDYFRYITDAQAELFPKIPLFSGPPANVRSNISNGAIGYFAAFDSDSTSNIIKESDVVK